jgi:hypothetical protein
MVTIFFERVFRGQKKSYARNINGFNLGEIILNRSFGTFSLLNNSSKESLVQLGQAITKHTSFRSAAPLRRAAKYRPSP